MVKKEDQKTDIIDIPRLTDHKSEIFTLIEIALSHNASDLHLSVGNHPVLRIDGKLLPIFERPKLTPGYIEKLVNLLINNKQRKVLKENKELDFSYIFRDQAFLRANVFYQKNSLACVIRLIPSKIKNFEELNLPLTISRFTRETQGLVLVTGPTGSGKSSTIAAILDEINRTRAEHILTIEDPIEYVFQPKQSIINQREVRRDTLSFKNALLSALREDFNVILIGELRDLDSISSALTIAEAGHLVFATIHATDAVSAPDRIVNAFPPYYQVQVRSQLAHILLGVIAQRLLPKIDGGRVPAVEIMIANNAVRNLIREGKSNQLKSVIETSREEGMMTFEQSIERLLEEGKISEEIIRKIK